MLSKKIPPPAKKSLLRKPAHKLVSKKPSHLKKHPLKGKKPSKPKVNLKGSVMTPRITVVNDIPKNLPPPPIKPREVSTGSVSGIMSGNTANSIELDSIKQKAPLPSPIEVTLHRVSTPFATQRKNEFAQAPSLKLPDATIEVMPKSSLSGSCAPSHGIVVLFLLIHFSVPGRRL